MKKVLIPIANGTEEMEATILIDTLRRAGAEVTVASVQDLQIKASRGLNIVADELIENCKDVIYDVIALPGGLPGADHLRDSAILKELLIAQKASGRIYSAVCASPEVVLQSHGLLEDKIATAYPGLDEKLTNPAKPRVAVVVDGNCVTSQAAGTTFAFALTLAEILFGFEKAKEIADSMLVPYKSVL